MVKSKFIRTIPAEDINSIFASFFSDNKNVDPAHTYEHCLSISKKSASLYVEEAKEDFDFSIAEFVAIIGLLHELSDGKLLVNRQYKKLVERFMIVTESSFSYWIRHEFGVNSKDAGNLILRIVDQISWSKNKNNVPKTGVIKSPKMIKAIHQAVYCVRDADRMQCLGAIGKKRAIDYGSHHGRTEKESLEHYADKLKSFIDSNGNVIGFHTNKGKEIFSKHYNLLLSQEDTKGK